MIELVQQIHQLSIYQDYDKKAQYLYFKEKEEPLKMSP